VTRIEFYHDVADKLAAACELIGECQRAGHRVLVFAPQPALAAAIDRLLWTQPAIGFLPHSFATSPLAAETPVVISASLDDASHDDVLLNLDGDLPAGFSRFRRLIEIVGREDSDRVPARSRFKHYRDRGYELHALDFGSWRP
jgi:DNA polymerase-3 subunit chi